MVDASLHLQFCKTPHFGYIRHVQVDHGEKQLFLLIIWELRILNPPGLAEANYSILIADGKFTLSPFEAGPVFGATRGQTHSQLASYQLFCLLGTMSIL